MSQTYQDFIDKAVGEGIAPGLQATIFTKDSFIFNGVSGLAKTAGEDSKGVSMEKDTGLALFSASKVVVSLVVLRILEQGLSKTPFSLSDLDDHENLVSILPEFKLGSGSMVTKILEGFGPVGADGKKELKLRDAKKGCTLRHLLTHTAGLSYPWNEPSNSELFRPTEGEPHFPNLSLIETRDFNYPLVCEVGERYIYGASCEWIGQFAVRSTGTNLRELCKTLVFEPLGLINEDEIDLIPVKKNAGINIRTGEKHSFMEIPFELHQPPDGWNPEEGKFWLGSGPVRSSLQSYSKVLQATLNHDSRLLSEETWQMAVSDQTTSMGVKMEIPTWKSSAPEFTYDIDEFSAQVKPGDFGINLLQAQVFKSPTVTGKPGGSHAWAGLANVFWFLDPDDEIGSIIGAQLLPFYDPQMVKLRDEWEKLIYAQLKVKTDSSDSETKAL